MTKTTNIPEGRLIEVRSMAECPRCKHLNHYYWMPGMRAQPENRTCLRCGGLYRLHSDD